MNKYMRIEDSKNSRKSYILRTAYPQYLFRLLRDPTDKSKSVTVHNAVYNIEIVRDYNSYGEIPETYLKEMARFCFHNGHTDQNVTSENVESLLPEIDKELGLKSIFEWINAAYVAENCFEKDRTWLYQRLNGNLVNGKPAELNQDQKELLADYFQMKAHELIEMAKILENDTNGKQ